MRKYALSALAILALVSSCAGKTSYVKNAQKHMATALETTKIAEAAFVSWDEMHQQSLVARAMTPEEAQESLAAYRLRRQPVIKAFVVAYSSLAAVAALMPLVEKGLEPEAKLTNLLGEAFSAALAVQQAVNAIRKE